MSEIWKPVVGFEDIYEVSDRGRVRRVAPASGAQPGHVLKPQTGRGGHQRVNLHRDGAAVSGQVHTLVARAFIGERPGRGWYVAHRNGDKADNRAGNLAWRPRATIAPRRKLTPEQARAIRTRYAAGGVTLAELAREYGVSLTAVGQVTAGRTWRDAGGSVTPPRSRRARAGRDAKLTPDAVRALRRERAAGVPLHVLAGRYGVTAATASSAANRRTWKHVE